MFMNNSDIGNQFKKIVFDPSGYLSCLRGVCKIVCKIELGFSIVEIALDSTIHQIYEFSWLIYTCSFFFTYVAHLVLVFPVSSMYFKPI